MPVGEPKGVEYHRVGLRDGERVTWCFYTRPGESEIVALGRARRRCPRCGAELR